VLRRIQAKGTDVYATIDPEGGSALVRDGAVLLDIREVNEWVAGHASVAIHIPMGAIDSTPELPFSESDKVVVMCRSGRRSIPVTEYLQAKGYDAVNYEGGMQAWVQLGGDIIDAEGNTGIVL
jgi:rhodanese-related sulfurtransferase